MTDDDLIDALAEAHTGTDFEVMCHRASARMLAMQKAIEAIRIATDDFQGNAYKRVAEVRRILQALDKSE